MDDSLIKKIEQAVHLIQCSVGDDVVEVSYSGGKDSDVILELVRMAGVKYRAIYKNTTIDPVGTIAHCKKKGVEIINPKISFLQLVEKKGMPTRRARFCCGVLKEYKVLDKAIQGIRRSESVKRAKNYSADDPVICRIYGPKKNHVSVILPILNWSDEDVREFVDFRNLKCHPLYYDDDGKFCVDRRLGCIGCPLKSDNGRGDFILHPKLFVRMVRAVEIWWYTHPDAKSRIKFRDVYGLIAHNLFYDSYVRWREDDNTLFGYENWKLFLEQYFKVDL